MSECTKTKSVFVKLVYFHKCKREMIQNDESLIYHFSKLDRNSKDIIHYNIEGVESAFSYHAHGYRPFYIVSCRCGDSFFIDIEFKKTIENLLGYEIS